MGNSCSTCYRQEKQNNDQKYSGNPQDDSVGITSIRTGNTQSEKPIHSQTNDAKLGSLNIDLEQDSNLENVVQARITDEASGVKSEIYDDDFGFMEKNSTPPGFKSEVGEHELLGISVHYLATQFITEVEEAGLSKISVMRKIEDLGEIVQDGVIRKKGACIACPIDQKMGAAYVHSISDKDQVGKPSIMLSYTWESSIGSIVNALTHHCVSEGLDQKKTFVWINNLCTNQHRVIDNKKNNLGVSHSAFHSGLLRRTKEIGHVLVPIAPWRAPSFLTQSWCLLEIFVANQYECKVTFSMSQIESDELLKCLMDRHRVNRVKDFFRFIGAIDVQDTAVWSERDRTNIMHYIEHVGYEKFNSKVCELVKDWALGYIEKEIQMHRFEDEMSQVQQGNMLNSVADLFHGIRDFDKLLGISKKAFNLNKIAHGLQSKATAKSIELVGIGLLMMGEREEAMKWMKDSLRIREDLFGREHGETSDSIRWIAKILRMNGEMEEAFEMHEKALHIREKVYGRKHVKTAESLYAVAWMVKEKGDIKNALKMFKEVLEIEKSVLQRNYIEKANEKFNIASEFYRDDKKEQALKSFKQAILIFRNVYGSDHPGTKQTNDWIIRISAELGI